MIQKFIRTAAGCLLLSVSATAFSQDGITPQKGTARLVATIDLSKITEDWEPSIMTVKEAPKPGSAFSERKKIVERLREAKHGVATEKYYKSSTAPNPVVGSVYGGNTSDATPNDNDLSISNGGMIVSVVNTNFRVMKEDGSVVKSLSLKSLAKLSGVGNFTFDPRTLYDPDADRFIVVFLNGSSSASSSSVVLVSKTNDPSKEWNVYQLPGANLFKNNTWTDYPIIALSKEDIFLTVNLLDDGKGWKDGFTQSIIWQIRKKEAYDGDTAIKYNKWSEIKYGGTYMWNICPAQGGDKPTGPKMYFLTVRPSDLQNDSIFLHTISDTYGSGTATLTTRLIKASHNYGLPPSAEQPSGKKLATNDGRVLTAMIQNDMIQFAGNCVDTNNYASAIYHGYFGINDNTATLRIISSDSVDYGYPDIAYAGSGSWDNSAVLTFSHVSKNTPAGASVIYMDRNYNYSDVVRVRSGTGSLNLLADSTERWGDYAGIQRKYSDPRTFWLGGSLGQNPKQGCVIGQVTNNDPATGTPIAEMPELKATIYPNPSTQIVYVDFDMPQPAYLKFSLYDINGKLVDDIVEDRIKAGQLRFGFNVSHLASGTYFLRISNGNNMVKNEKIIVHH